ncbi:hypothetical protein BG015_002224 [Linnemannia schmuckeri]|uniref:Uncharacterized protein n=1 Tax=Linnemannia schmuckeri TaxID=64567 RepID=A0A9P5S357_9FUNG|nr:hypothetical protein BG015_002224 [Linnemannia schmuckeri]
MDRTQLRKNPLDLTKIQALFVSFLNLNERVACMHISRDWFRDFVGPVWHTIDLAKDKKSVELSSLILSKYDYCIRQVFNIYTLDYIKLLRDLKQNNIESPSPSTLTALPSESHLTSLTLNQGCFDHKDFTRLLQSSPILRNLTFSRVIVMGYNSSCEKFKGSSVTSLHASLAEICISHADSGRTLILLHQFSQVQEWHLAAVDQPSIGAATLAFVVNSEYAVPTLRVPALIRLTISTSFQIYLSIASNH